MQTLWRRAGLPLRLRGSPSRRSRSCLQSAVAAHRTADLVPDLHQSRRTMLISGCLTANQAYHLPVLGSSESQGVTQNRTRGGTNPRKRWHQLRREDLKQISIARETWHITDTNASPVSPWLPTMTRSRGVRSSIGSN